MRVLLLTWIFCLVASSSFAAGGILVHGNITMTKEAADPYSVLSFSDGSSQSYGQPWSYNNFDLYYLGGRIGIGKVSPSTALDVNGTVTATGFSGNGSGLTNVTAATVADGSITDAKISGPISAGKLDLSGVQKKYGKVAVVAQSGGDYTNPVTAMAGVATWCGTPSAANPCLLKIMPGVYTVASAVVMQQYIDIEGSGGNVTKITAALNSGASSPPLNATVKGASNAELRHISVENISSGLYTFGLMNNGASPVLSNVNITATGGTSNNYAVYNYSGSSPKMTNVTAISLASAAALTYSTGIYNTSSSPTMLNVTASATGETYNYGVWNTSSSSPTMTNVAVTATGGTQNYGVMNNTSSPNMTNVTVSASGGTNSNSGISNTSSSPTMTNVTVSVSGPANSNSGIINSSSSSPIMMNVTVAASGGSSSTTGISNSSSSPFMKNITVTASGSDWTYGIRNVTASPTMTDITVTATGTGAGSGSIYGINNSSSSSPIMSNVTTTATATVAASNRTTGVYCFSSSPVMTHVTATATGGGSSNYGIHSESSGTVKINNSVIKGTTNTIYNQAGSTLLVGNSQLAGGAVSNAGSLTCAGVYDENYVFSASTCP